MFSFTLGGVERSYLEQKLKFMKGGVLLHSLLGARVVVGDGAALLPQEQRPEDQPPE